MAYNQVAYFMLQTAPLATPSGPKEDPWWLASLRGLSSTEWCYCPWPIPLPHTFRISWLLAWCYHLLQNWFGPCVHQIPVEPVVTYPTLLSPPLSACLSSWECHLDCGMQLKHSSASLTWYCVACTSLRIYWWPAHCQFASRITWAPPVIGPRALEQPWHYH